MSMLPSTLTLILIYICMQVCSIELVLDDIEGVESVGYLKMQVFVHWLDPILRNRFFRRSGTKVKSSKSKVSAIVCRYTNDNYTIKEGMWD